MKTNTIISILLALDIVGAVVGAAFFLVLGYPGACVLTIVVGAAGAVAIGGMEKS